MEKEMLTFNLKKEWYDKIRSSEKTVEYREVKRYWTARIENLLNGSASITPASQLMERLKNGQSVKFIFCPCILQLGYTRQRLIATITKIEVVDGKDTDLHVDKPVYAIHIANVEEKQ